ncbi:DUF6223 family protein [Bizionia paragorgiae]|uniref:DUF6223 family protein n=1 Tax=Bizionia paragorgiae TaxID=283786 RepID=UPI003A958276
MKRTGFKITNLVIKIVTIILPHIAAAQEINENVFNKLTSGRLYSLLTIIIGISSVIIGLRSIKLLSVRLKKNNRKIGGLWALIFGLVGLILSGIHLAKTNSDFGSGSGKAGYIFAFLISAIGICLALIIFYRLKNDSKNLS